MNVQGVSTAASAARRAATKPRHGATIVRAPAARASATVASPDRAS